jgi:toxin-antitoxin system PIN domain toxin
MRRGEVYLLDANVLIALATPDHTGHERARAWFARGPQFATCPITQGALIRFYLRWGEGPSIDQAKRILSRIAGMEGHTFWPDDVSYLDVPGRGVMGHRQVTDAYLVALAAAREGLVATMDEALAAVHEEWCVLV